MESPVNQVDFSRTKLNPFKNSPRVLIIFGLSPSASLVS
jgi:hypothetical protein